MCFFLLGFYLFSTFVLCFIWFQAPFCLTNANQFHACQLQLFCDRECLDKSVYTYEFKYNIYICLWVKFAVSWRFRLGVLRVKLLGYVFLHTIFKAYFKGLTAYGLTKCKLILRVRVNYKIILTIPIQIVFLHFILH